jgi:protein gp37
MADTKIAWTEKVWNPVTGCTKVSEGCKNCYAEKMAKRLMAMGSPKYFNGFDPTWHADYLDEPYKWKKPCKIFVCSMGDLFHKKIPFEFHAHVWDTMFNLGGSELRSLPKHIFLILTKRPERILEFSKYMAERGRPINYSNVWIGTSAENQEQANKRIPVLLKTPAVKRFVSIEPMLGPVDLSKICLLKKDGSGPDVTINSLFGWHGGLDSPDKTNLDWVIVGAESGPNRRPCKIEWVRDIVNQCKKAGVPVFVKQLDLDGKLSKDPEEWPEDLRIQEFPK